MPTFRLNKLIRDKLPSFYDSIGQKATIKVLSKKEHTKALVEKIVEEVQEIPTDEVSTKKLIEEIADVQQAIDDLVKINGINETQIKQAQKNKNEQKGGFIKGVYVEKLELQENDTWIDYYRADPERFPEENK